MINVLVVGFGGFFGAISRYKIGGIIYHLTQHWKYPIGTFLVNIIGCFLIGFLGGLVERELLIISPKIKLFLFTGVLGGFTTFSAFSYETLFIFRKGDFGIGLLSLFGTLFFCMLAVAIGVKLAHL